MTRFNVADFVTNNCPIRGFPGSGGGKSEPLYTGDQWVEVQS